MTLRKNKMIRLKKREILSIIKTLIRANDAIAEAHKNAIDSHIADTLMQCQETALILGNYLETLEENGRLYIHILEDYCEDIYQMYINIGNKTIEELLLKKIYDELAELDSRIQSEVPDDKREIIFLPYKAAMWDALESVWMAACKDDTCIVHVIPIPYFDKNPDGSLGNMHYEGAEYPNYVTITSWEEYDLEEQRPDIAYVHNPYDNANHVTCIHPAFFARNLKKYVDTLVYIPYFVAVNNQVPVHFCVTPVTLLADKLIVQSEPVRQTYIKELQRFEKENNCIGLAGTIEKKVLALGSPKYDKLDFYRLDETEIPTEWKKIIFNQNGNRKRVILYNTSVQNMLTYGTVMLHKIKETLEIFETYKNEIALLWRPHPLMSATLQSLRPELWNQYEKIMCWYQKTGWGIFDESFDMNRAIAVSDGYYGDSGSVLELYQGTGKPYYKQWVNTLMADTGFNILIQCVCKGGKDTYAFSRINNALFYVKNGNRLEYIGSDPREETWRRLLYTDMIQAEGKIYFAPGTANQILVYDYAQHSFSYIFLEYADKTPKRTLKFVRIYAEGNELYLIPKEYPCIVRINTKTGGQEHLHVADLSEKVEKENDVKPPKIENERSILFASGHGQDQLYISYHKMMGLYSDGDAEVIHADRKGNITGCIQYSVENADKYRNAVGQTTRRVLEFIFTQIQNTRGHLGQERKHCGDNIHQVIVREKYEPDCIIYRRDL